ncbi:MAG: GNAT family N-acetyltransferase [Oscillospiraceae bacterium]|nr:GNAT family N-acetyltransferase [Oscillospiraceae bacterium]
MQVKQSSEKIKEFVHGRLQLYNKPYMEDIIDFSYHIEENEETIAGIVAESVYDTVEVQYLLVEESRRGQGLGKQLLKMVEEKAKEAGMKRIRLNTYSFQTPAFYQQNGYELLLKLDPAFGPHQQYFFEKRL